MGIEAPQIPEVGSSEEINASVSFVGKLDDGELLTGTPTVEELGTADLTLSSKTVNTGALTINGRSVATGQAVQFHITGQQAGRLYRIKLTCATDATPAQRRSGVVRFSARDDSS